MLKLLCFLFTLGIANCSKHKDKSSTGDMLEDLKAKSESYAKLSKEVRDEDGWILADECDALLHSSLAYAGGAVDYADLFRARDEDGRWWRRPARDCLSSGGSRSTISRDMLLGLLVAIVVAHDLDAAEKLVQYGESHDWVMGEHDGTLDGKNRVYATPAFQSLIYQVRHKLGGKYHGSEEIPQVYVPHDGFEAHLQALTILVRGLIHGSITDIELNTMKSQVEKDPNNALFRAILAKFSDGNQSEAVRILLREDLFPSGRLPTSDDHCVPYLFMHGEKASDWSPCDQGKIHPGHDLLFTSFVVFENSAGLRSYAVY